MAFVARLRRIKKLQPLEEASVQKLWQNPVSGGVEGLCHFSPQSSNFVDFVEELGEFLVGDFF